MFWAALITSVQQCCSDSCPLCHIALQVVHTLHAQHVHLRAERWQKKHAYTATQDNLMWLTAKPVPARSMCGSHKASCSSRQSYALPVGQQPHSPALEVLVVPDALVEDAVVASTLRGAFCTATNTGRTPEAHTSLAPVGRQRIKAEHLPQLVWCPGLPAAQVSQGAGLAFFGYYAWCLCTAQHVWHTGCPDLWLLNHQANERFPPVVSRLQIGAPELHTLHAAVSAC